MTSWFADANTHRFKGVSRAVTGRSVTVPEVTPFLTSPGFSCVVAAGLFSEDTNNLVFPFLENCYFLKCRLAASVAVNPCSSLLSLRSPA